MTDNTDITWIATENSPPPAGHYSQAVAYGGEVMGDEKPGKSIIPTAGPLNLGYQVAFTVSLQRPDAFTAPR